MCARNPSYFTGLDLATDKPFERLTGLWGCIYGPTYAPRYHNAEDEGGFRGTLNWAPIVLRGGSLFTRRDRCRKAIAKYYINQGSSQIVYRAMWAIVVCVCVCAFACGRDLQESGRGLWSVRSGGGARRGCTYQCYFRGDGVCRNIKLLCLGLV